MALEYLPHYVAIVTATGLGDSGREIEAESEHMPASAGQISPYLDGILKFPPPEVGEEVLVIQADASNLYRWYVTIRHEYSNLTEDGTKVQLEAPADLELEGDPIKIGAMATEAAVLGNTLVDLLDQLITAMSAETHISPWLGIPTAPPVNAASYASIQALLQTALSLKIKVE